MMRLLIFSKHISSGKKIRGFGASEQFFVMLSLGIYFVTKVKSPKLKRRFFITVKALILDFNARKPLKFLVKHHKKPLIKLINTFGQLPERKTIINWDTDKFCGIKEREIDASDIEEQLVSCIHSYYEEDLIIWLMITKNLINKIIVFIHKYPSI